MDDKYMYQQNLGKILLLKYFHHREQLRKFNVNKKKTTYTQIINEQACTQQVHTPQGKCQIDDYSQELSRHPSIL